MSMQSGIKSDAGHPGNGLTPRAAIYRCNRLLRLLPGVRLQRYLFVYQPVTALPKLLPQFPVKLFEADDDALAQLWPEPGVRAYRFGQGARCLVVQASDRLAGGIWLVDGQFQEDEVRADYRFGSAYSWDFGLFIHPDFRGTRAFAALWGGVAADLRSRNKQGTLSRIADYLAPSLLAHARMGAKSVGQALFLCVGPLQYCWSSGALQHQNLATGAQFQFQPVVQ
jgi:hypothetical protein